MVKMNRKGEVVTITVIALALMAGAIGLFFAQTKYAKVLGLSSDAQKTKQVTTTTQECKPIMVTGQDGKTYYLQATTTKTSTLDTSEEPQMTMVQKLLLLPKMWILLMVLGIFFPPLSIFMGYLNGKLKTAATQIVNGVEKGLSKLPASEADTMKTELSKAYDTKTKKLVTNLKQK